MAVWHEDQGLLMLSRRCSFEASSALELRYLANDDDERYSIQVSRCETAAFLALKWAMARFFHAFRRVLSLKSAVGACPRRTPRSSGTWRCSGRSIRSTSAPRPRCGCDREGGALCSQRGKWPSQWAGAFPCMISYSDAAVSARDVGGNKGGAQLGPSDAVCRTSI